MANSRRQWEGVRFKCRSDSPESGARIDALSDVDIQNRVGNSIRPRLAPSPADHPEVHNLERDCNSSATGHCRHRNPGFREIEFLVPARWADWSQRH